MKRVDVLNADIHDAITKTIAGIDRALKKHGKGAYASSREALGVIRGEYREYEKEVDKRNMKRQKEELIDLAAATIFAIACIDKMDY